MKKSQPKINRRWLLWTGLIALALIILVVILMQPRPKAATVTPAPPLAGIVQDPPSKSQPVAGAPVIDTPAEDKDTEKETGDDIEAAGQVYAPTEFGAVKNLGEYMQKIMVYALPTGVTLAIIMTIYAGIILMISQGQPDKVKEGKEIIQGAILGLIVLVLARLLATYLYLPSAQDTVILSTQANQAAESGPAQKEGQ